MPIELGASWFPRNVLRRSGSGSLVGVKHCFAAGWETGTKARQTLNTAKKTTSETVGDNFIVKRETAQTTS